MKNSTQSLNNKLGELALAVPQVMAHRLTRMALAGQTPSQRDRDEFERMSAEKGETFVQSWLAMGIQVGKLQQQFTWSWLRACAWPLLPGATSRAAKATPEQLSEAAVSVLNEGLAPVHRRAVANAKRLRATPVVAPRSK